MMAILLNAHRRLLVKTDWQWYVHYHTYFFLDSINLSYSTAILQDKAWRLWAAEQLVLITWFPAWKRGQIRVSEHVIHFNPLISLAYILINEYYLRQRAFGHLYIAQSNMFVQIIWLLSTKSNFQQQGMSGQWGHVIHIKTVLTHFLFQLFVLTVCEDVSLWKQT